MVQTIGSGVDTPFEPPLPLPRVLIVEDSPATAAWLSLGLLAAGLGVETVRDGEAARTCKVWFRPHIVLVDLGLPDVSGLALIEHFAGDADCGIIVVTADDSEATRIAVFEAGADDYIVKPPHPRELVARVRALHRRVGRSVVMAARVPPVLLDAASRCLVGPGRSRTPLTEAEWAVLETLLDADGASVSRDWLGRVALKRPMHDMDRSVDQIVMKLRRKIAAHGIAGRVILSSRGLGYVVPQPERFSISTEASVDA